MKGKCFVTVNFHITIQEGKQMVSFSEMQFSGRILRG